jgi:4-carboxymuconolactone decarboxylase
MTETPTPPRIAPIDPATAPDDIAQFLATATDSTGGAMNIFTTMANHPGLLRRYLPFGGKLLNGGVIDPRVRELLILRTAWNCWSEYEWGQHVRIGREAGLSDDEITLVTLGPEADGWSADDALVLTACDELCTTHTVSDLTWARLADHLDARELVELTLLVGHYVMIAGMLNALGVQREVGVEGFPST